MQSNEEMIIVGLRWLESVNRPNSLNKIKRNLTQDKFHNIINEY